MEDLLNALFNNTFIKEGDKSLQIKSFVFNVENSYILFDKHPTKDIPWKLAVKSVLIKKRVISTPSSSHLNIVEFIDFEVVHSEDISLYTEWRDAIFNLSITIRSYKQNAVLIITNVEDVKEVDMYGVWPLLNHNGTYVSPFKQSAIFSVDFWNRRIK